jgi:hypothetical protein
MKKPLFFTLIFFYVAAVFYLAATTPITPHEAKVLFTSHDVVSTLMKTGEQLVPGFLGLRLFFILFGFISIILFYLLSRRYFTKEGDTYLATVIFMFLPGILTGMALANIAIVVLPLVLLFVLAHENELFWPQPLLMLALFFIHEASVIFFVSVLIYAVIHKEKRLGIISSAFLLAFIFLAKGITIGGRPTGHFIEIFGLYATLFSPLVFIYFFYVMYRILLRGKKSLSWYIAFTALAFSLLLSIRQRIELTDFAPYVLIAVALMLNTLNFSIRVRLPQFQKVYRAGFYFVITTLVLNLLLIVFHQVTYYMSGKHEKHFAKRIYQPYDLAKTVKANEMGCYDAQNRHIQLQLKYYQIPSCSPDSN